MKEWKYPEIVDLDIKFTKNIGAHGSGIFPDQGEDTPSSIPSTQLKPPTIVLPEEKPCWWPSWIPWPPKWPDCD